MERCSSSGGGQSGCQIAEDLAQAGRTVYLSTSRVGRIPWLYRGRESLAWLVDCGFWDQRPHDLPDPADTELTIPLLAGGRSLDLRILSGLGVRLLGRFASADGELDLSDYSVRMAHELSIETVYQDKSLGEKQPLWRNFFVGRQITNRWGFIDVQREKAIAGRTSCSTPSAFAASASSADSTVRSCRAASGRASRSAAPCTSTPT